MSALMLTTDQVETLWQNASGLPFLAELTNASPAAALQAWNRCKRAILGGIRGEV